MEKKRAPKEKAGRYCVECGRSIPFDAKLCPYCGHKFGARRVKPGKAKAPSPRRLDRELLGYIAEHAGKISIPDASKELGVSRREIKAALERLKRAGKLEEE